MAEIVNIVLLPNKSKAKNSTCRAPGCLDSGVCKLHVPPSVGPRQMFTTEIPPCLCPKVM